MATAGGVEIPLHSIRALACIHGIREEFDQMSRLPSSLYRICVALAMPAWVAAEEPAAAKSGKSPSPTSPARSEELVRIEMLEKLADQLSHRMRSIKAREAALAAEEDALAEREKAARQREETISSMEELVRSREEVVKRREKLPPPQSWNGPPPPAVHGQYAAVLDGATMQFYHKKQAEIRVPVASTQKLVTALVICQDGDLDGLAEIPEEVLEVEPTLVGVKPGEKYPRRQLLTALLVKSGNDIAAALAIDNAGGIEAFAQKMNSHARAIGMTDSHFVNPHGLPAEGQYSTARDIAIAAFEAYQVPEIREMVSKRSFDFAFNDGRILTISNTNRVLDDLEGCNGMKTGFTYAAGNCLVCSASVDGRDRISVVLKSARPQVQEDSKALLSWALGLQFTGSIRP
jgi:D-alanyl-D-alanine carboxypeptidase (penicillin-binding protein 5/6)